MTATTGEARALTVANARAGDVAMGTALPWWVPGIALAIAYQVFAYHHLRGKLRPDDADAHATY